MSDDPTGIYSAYQCYRCDEEWRSLWDSACDDDCPRCGARHVSPFAYVEAEEEDDEALDAEIAAQEAEG